MMLSKERAGADTFLSAALPHDAPRLPLHSEPEAAYYLMGWCLVNRRLDPRITAIEFIEARWGGAVVNVLVCACASSNCAAAAAVLALGLPLGLLWAGLRWHAERAVVLTHLGEPCRVSSTLDPTHHQPHPPPAITQVPVETRRHGMDLAIDPHVYYYRPLSTYPP